MVGVFKSLSMDAVKLLRVRQLWPQMEGIGQKGLGAGNSKDGVISR